ncbi:NAD(P)H-quinone oxidoreductase subunit I, chloroplastic [Methanobrevibacter cuticularis]|uniref:NAD(P)H-quinone oxidoreductase subunit I, chloroplastic n=1 Tax=Methanobrevibacter cuticularis TaxID=47311 RepID=A0A166E0F2_9EURY|nr:dihydromethanopterin reductase (acceptor) [Methanobrevibacter cuticularis]KZX16143.1 NAD(P)H-quinone oxidoreductase subunit I, chloroplastic [Methanobrevibacter cuticularis]
MKIAWGITGAGHLLSESVEILEELVKDHKITIFLSNAGEEVLKMYGLYERVTAITGGYYRELALDSDQSFSYPISGRLSLGKYDLFILSPTTSNTVAKIVHGIGDSLMTTSVAQAGKGGVQTLIVPVDLEIGDVETILPSKLELESCADCETCEASKKCNQGAILPKTEINLLKCIGCGECEDACPFNAISAGKKITIHMRDIDIENTHKLVLMDGIYVLKHPNEIMRHI